MSLSRHIYQEKKHFVLFSMLSTTCLNIRLSMIWLFRSLRNILECLYNPSESINNLNWCKRRLYVLSKIGSITEHTALFFLGTYSLKLNKFSSKIAVKCWLLIMYRNKHTFEIFISDSKQMTLFIYREGPFCFKPFKRIAPVELVHHKWVSLLIISVMFQKQFSLLSININVMA